MSKAHRKQEAYFRNLGKGIAQACFRRFSKTAPDEKTLRQAMWLGAVKSGKWNSLQRRSILEYAERYFQMLWRT